MLNWDPLKFVCVCVCHNQLTRLPETETCLDPPKITSLMHFLLLCCCTSFFCSVAHSDSFMMIFAGCLCSENVRWMSPLSLGCSLHTSVVLLGCSLGQYHDFWKCWMSWGCNYVPCLSGNDCQGPLHLQTGPWMDEKATWFLVWPLLKPVKL